MVGLRVKLGYRAHVEFGCENALLPSLSRRSRVQVPAGANAFYFTGCQIK